MKRIVLSVLLSASVFSACKKDEAAKAPEGKAAAVADKKVPPPPKPVTFARIDIKNSGAPIKDFTIEAPTGATSEEMFTNTMVKAGPRFAILISHGKADIAGSKAAFSGTTGTIKSARFVVDAPDALLFEGDFVGERGYHVNVAKVIGGVHFSCQSQRKMGLTFTQQEAEHMLRACRSLAKK